MLRRSLSDARKSGDKDHAVERSPDTGDGSRMGECRTREMAPFPRCEGSPPSPCG